MRPQEWTTTTIKAADAIVDLINRNREDTNSKAPFGQVPTRQK